jgi:hypothetical protein
MRLYMAVTVDEFELPLYVTDTVVDMDRWASSTPIAVSTAITRGRSGKYNGFKYIKVEFEDVEED